MSDDPFRPPDSNLGSDGKSLYPVSGIIVATILGSLAAGIFLIYLNYLGLGYRRLATLTIRWGIVVYMLIIALASLMPNTPAYGLLFIFLQTGLAGFAADRLQGTAIAYHREHGGMVHSLLRAAGVGILTGLVLIFVLILMAVVFAAFTT